MPKTKKKSPKISAQLFSKMVENTVGAKVHLNFAALKGGDVQRAHFNHAKGYLKELSQQVENLRWHIGEAIMRIPVRQEDPRGRPIPKRKK